MRTWLSPAAGPPPKPMRRGLVCGEAVGPEPLLVAASEIGATALAYSARFFPGAGLWKSRVLQQGTA